MSDLTIRQYRTTDQAAVHEISSDTAFFGEPVEAFLEDRKLYWDAFAGYYTDHKTPFVWVAESSQEVIGYLLGCADTKAQTKHWRGYILSKVLTRAMKGSYKLGKHTGSFALGMLIGLIRGEEAKVDLNIYPAHLQIDVKNGHRGMGVGKRLIEAYVQQLKQLRVPGVHLGTTSYNIAACHLYEKIGFQILDRRLNRYWSRMLGFYVENRSYGLKLK